MTKGMRNARASVYRVLGNLENALGDMVCAYSAGCAHRVIAGR
jgi:hypothetical protein